MNEHKTRIDHIDPSKLKTPADLALYAALKARVAEQAANEEAKDKSDEGKTS